MQCHVCDKQIVRERADEACGQKGRIEVVRFFAYHVVPFDRLQRHSDERCSGRVGTEPEF